MAKFKTAKNKSETGRVYTNKVGLNRDDFKNYAEYRKEYRKRMAELPKYKKFFAEKHNIEMDQIETHFGLLKRTAKKGQRVEIFRVTSGDKKTKNAVKLLTNALYNISNKRHLKNRLSCHKMYGTCPFFKTEHCT